MATAIAFYYKHVFISNYVRITVHIKLSSHQNNFKSYNKNLESIEKRWGNNPTCPNGSYALETIYLWSTIVLIHLPYPKWSSREQTC